MCPVLAGAEAVKHSTTTTIAALQAAGISDPVEEMRFHPTRRWRFDYAWPDYLLAWEIEGLTTPGTALGRHQRNAGLAADCEKYNAATIMGWRLIRTTTRQIESGQALRWLLQALGAEQ